LYFAEKKAERKAILQKENEKMSEDFIYELIQTVENAIERHRAYESPLIKEAVEFAKEAHKGQVRKYTGEPYITHPLAVIEILKNTHINLEPETIAAAILHDVIEDCGVKQEELEEKFGSEVARIVWALTDESKPSDGNRAARKEIDRKWFRNKACYSVRLIKLADMLDNARSIVEHDPKFAKVFFAEKKLLLSECYSSDWQENVLFKELNQLEKDFETSCFQNRNS
jgi:(p)ppGpp synthase/HD superfamily hydrolase